MNNTLLHILMVVLSYSKLSLIVFLLHLYVRQLLYKCDYKYQDFLDDRDNSVVNIKI